MPFATKKVFRDLGFAAVIDTRIDGAARDTNKDARTLR